MSTEVEESAHAQYGEGITRTSLSNMIKYESLPRGRRLISGIDGWKGIVANHSV